MDSSQSRLFTIESNGKQAMVTENSRSSKIVLESTDISRIGWDITGGMRSSKIRAEFTEIGWYALR